MAINDGVLINVEERLGISENLTCPKFTNTDVYMVNELRFWVGGVVSCLIAVFGLLTNLASAYVLLTNPSLKNLFNTFLSIQLIMDSFCLFFIIIEVVSNIFKLRTQLYDIFLPYFLHPFTNISLTSSIFMTIAISHERYNATTCPFIHRRRRRSTRFRRMLLVRYTTIVVFCAVLINIPKFFEAELQWTCNNKTISYKETNDSIIKTDAE